MIQRYDWKCECGHMRSIKAVDGPWCSAKTADELREVLLAAIDEWEQKHGPWRRAMGADHWIARASKYTWADGSPRNEPYYVPNPEVEQ